MFGNKLQLKRAVAFTALFVLLNISTWNFAQAENTTESDASFELVFVGDIFLGNWAEEFITQHGQDYPYAGCKEIFQKADLVIANLENPITNGGEPIVEKQYLLKAKPGIEKGLKQANIHAVNLANNHILDYGYEGLASTVKFLDEAGIKYFGAGDNLESAFQEAVFEIKGTSVAFLGFSATFPEEFWATDSTGGTAFPWGHLIIPTIEKCNENYDIVVVSFHWGAEKKEYPKDYQIELAHDCIKAGADLIIGHHPHVVQGVEIFDSVPVFYSLGNFAFASYSENAKIGLVVRAKFSEESLESIESIPVDVYNAERNFQPLPLENEARKVFFSHFQTLSDSLNNFQKVINEDGILNMSAD